jgi:hypothetical protein
MKGWIEHRLRAAAMLLLILAIMATSFTGMVPMRAGARASLVAYLTASPNAWEPMGFNANGAARFAVDHQGWNVSRTFGNVGIGDGSPRALNLSSNVNGVDYKDKLMAGDVSARPWDPSMVRDFSTGESGASEGDGQETKAGASFGGTTALNDPYHSILLGRPSADLLYQHPHAVSANVYSRLVGLRMPGGAVANVGMRAIGYGY